MRHFEDGQTLVIEPFRATPFKVVKDLVVDRSSFDSIIQAGGYISVSTGNAPDANNILISKDDAENAFDSAACIGCGACVASCPNASAALFTSAKISHLSFLPQGKVEGDERVKSMVDTMDSEGFGACSNHGECEAVCPKGISISNIALMRKNLIKTIL
jgi:succinate dehydrogenase / fumarate reductase iron-sulfur subunit